MLKSAKEFFDFYKRYCKTEYNFYSIFTRFYWCLYCPARGHLLGPRCRSPVLAFNLYLPALVPNLYLPALASYLYLPALGASLHLPALTPNSYLPAMAPNLYSPAQAPNLYLPALAYNFITSQWPEVCIYRPCLLNLYL